MDFRYRVNWFGDSCAIYKRSETGESYDFVGSAIVGNGDKDGRTPAQRAIHAITGQWVDKTEYLVCR